MAKPTVPYAIRNELASRLTSSMTGFFLDDAIRHMKPYVVKPYTSRKGFAQLLRFLADHPRLVVTELTDDGRNTRQWLHDKDRHAGQAFPAGYHEVVQKVDATGATVVVEPPADADDFEVWTDDVVYVPEEPTPAVDYTPRKEQVKPGSMPTIDSPLANLGFKRDPVPERPARTYSTRSTEEVPGPFAGLKDLLSQEKSQPAPAAIVVEEQKQSPAPVAQSAIETEKEDNMTANTALNFANMDPAQLANIGQQLLEASKKAEKQQQLAQNLERVRELQLEIAAATVTIERITEEALVASERLSKASEELRKLVAR